MHKLITRGLPVALALGAVLCGPAAAYAGTPDNGGKAVGHATTPPGKAKGHTPAPTPEPTPDPGPVTYQRQTATTVTYDGNRYGSTVVAWCDAGDYATTGSTDLNGDGAWTVTQQGPQGDIGRAGWYAWVAPADWQTLPIGAQVTAVVHATCVDTSGGVS